MSLFWDFALYFGSHFFSLSPRKKIIVGTIFLASVVILWFGFFGLRVWAIYDADDMGYRQALKFNRKCNTDPETLELSYSDCKKAEALTLHTLFRNSMQKAWNTSYVCGSAPCLDIIFGIDSTFTSGLARLAVVGTIGIVLFFFYLVLVSIAKRFDDLQREKAAALYGNYEHLPLPEVAGVFHDRSGIFTTPSSPTLTQRKQQRTPTVVQMPDDADGDGDSA